MEDYRQLRVIINADDFGKDAGTNKAIISEIQKGSVTSASIMANGEDLDGAVSFALSNSKTSFGVHLVLDELRPVSKDLYVLKTYGIVCDKGEFVRNKIRTLKLNQEILDAIFVEWDTQISIIENKGVFISHIDSHHHIHTIPGLCEVLKALMLKHQITKVRLASYYTFKMLAKGYDILGKGRIYDFVYMLIKYRSIRNRVKWNVSIKESFQTVDFFSSVLFFWRNRKLFEENWAKMQTIELMCHPGHPHYLSERQALNSLLECDSLIKINYKQL